MKVGQWDAIRFDKDTMRAVEAGPDGVEYLAFGAGDDPRDAEMAQNWWADEASTPASTLDRDTPPCERDTRGTRTSDRRRSCRPPVANASDCRSMRSLTTTLVLCGLGLSLIGSAGAVPKPPPKFWSPARCERVMLTQHPAVRQVICIGSGGPTTCRWTSGHRAGLFSKLSPCSRGFTNGTSPVPSNPALFRSFTLATRARTGFERIVHHYGDQYAGWPADFFLSHVGVLATHATPARFRSIVARDCNPPEAGARDDQLYGRMAPVRTTTAEPLRRSSPYSSA